MSIKKIKDRLNKLFDLPVKKQATKDEKLRSVIDSLEKRKLKLKKEIKKRKLKNDASSDSKELYKEFRAVSKLIRRAEKRCSIRASE
ncbi:MAG: hypothetical protein Q9M14_08655 [Mariprofundaceae bacterium]|nr:hypothetical protein [Mariprofundaceae bacterium]